VVPELRGQTGFNIKPVYIIVDNSLIHVHVPVKTNLLYKCAFNYSNITVMV